MDSILKHIGIRDKSLLQKLRISRSCICQTADIVTDVLIIITWVKSGALWWSALAVSFILISSLLGACNFRFYFWAFQSQSKLARDPARENTCTALTLGLLDLQAVYCAIRVWGLKEYSYSWDQEYYGIHFMESFESVPSSALQLYILMGKTLGVAHIANTVSESSPLDWVSITIGYLSTMAGTRGFFMMSMRSWDVYQTIADLGTCQFTLPLVSWILCENIHRVVSMALWYYVADTTRFGLRVLRYGLMPFLGVLYGVIGWVAIGGELPPNPEEVTGAGWLNVIGVIVPCLEVFAMFFDDEKIPRKYSRVFRIMTFLRQILDIGIGVAALYLYQFPVGNRAIPSSSFWTLLLWCLVCIGTAGWGCAMSCLQVFGVGTNSVRRGAKSGITVVSMPRMRGMHVFDQSIASTQDVTDLKDVISPSEQRTLRSSTIVRVV